MADYAAGGVRNRRVDRTDPPGTDGAGPGSDQPDGVWRAFRQAILAFHHRVALTAMCRCGRTVIECDVLAQARFHKLVPAVPDVPRGPMKLPGYSDN